ncbi:hypothetical protein COT30_03120 [Candidatus Micrarchaeota archaeon CG08_land_8_20_14_0_20_49_17]|nr:MAG: hypothetical protein AUJ13_02520 [Candidatus Micrarchaeota archaeon CG1_02_49_24]PIU09700.1 MAG: hypothetical protein COT30_03120 [Candidatus Micrarchaeota archaeon CG08_land_8_20_14_0_20_49_17]PIU82528.1 MAG: hypothetical protein COS70_00855 [Candidatus Micrarchaeota archaeon CG06_land_8_20_14_3_00_50_6]PIZ96680.1 MAG: hypothetical protein COX84_03680 [Candidatus Micrarchaeota archaeon CG_4_10_14_0_2_um_filter_49_7]HII53400.1 type II toxin-antitoxin system HicB family antitoxin [Candid
MKQVFTAIIEKDENGIYIVEVPSLRGCYTQGGTLDEAMKNIREVIEMCLEEQKDIPKYELVGIQKIEVSR